MSKNQQAVFTCVFTTFVFMACLVSYASDPHLIPRAKGRRALLAKQLVELSDLRYSQGVFYIAPKNWRAEIRPDVIYLQTPQPGSKLATGGTVACWTFAKATESQSVIQMPNLRGKSVAEAKRQIEELRLRLVKSRPLGTATKSDSDTENDTQRDSSPQTVHDHYPRPGQNIYEGTSVFLLLQAPQK